MSLRYQFAANSESTPLMHCPKCGYTGRGWQRFPKPSKCAKIWAGFLTVFCCCCCPFLCDCSISWEWMCPSCHHLHKESDPHFSEMSVVSISESE